MSGILVATGLAAAFAVLIATVPRLRDLARRQVARAWRRMHRTQQDDIDALRRDVDGLLKILDRQSCAGAGDWSAKHDYAEQILLELGKRGIWTRE